MVDVWDPDQYNQFANEREAPFWDLAALLVPVQNPALADLGCGDGRLTAALHERLGARLTTGVDRSPAMIDAAQSRATATIAFVLGDIGEWQPPEACDVAFANASLHWLPDHPAVLARWTKSLRAAGQLAVQVPANADHPAHRLAAEVARAWMDIPPPDPVAQNVLSPEAYGELMDGLGYVKQHVRLQVYAHHLGSTSAIVDWLKGTTLNRFKPHLGPEQWEAFVEACRDRLVHEFGERSPYLYLFKRILIWGQLPERW